MKKESNLHLKISAILKSPLEAAAPAARKIQLSSKSSRNHRWRGGLGSCAVLLGAEQEGVCSLMISSNLVMITNVHK